MYSYGPPHMAVQEQDDQHEHTFSSYVRIRDAVLKTCLGRWTIGRRGERGSGISVLPARYDDDDDIYIYIYIYNVRNCSLSPLLLCSKEGVIFADAYYLFTLAQCRILSIECERSTITRYVTFHITSLTSLISGQTSYWPIYISTTSSHVNSSSTIHFNTCVCWLEIRVRPKSPYLYIPLYNIAHTYTHTHTHIYIYIYIYI